MPIRHLIRTIPHYPRPGIQFRDITTLIKDADGFKQTIGILTARYAEHPIDVVVGIEARGFIIGAALALALNKGFVPVRKRGKLPGPTLRADYTLEYGTDAVEMHVDAIPPGASVLLVDDLIATGGTAQAAIGLIEASGGTLWEACFVVDLPDLGGHARLQAAGYSVFAITAFEGE
ncbi:MAG: adenine phosphoribosyltransferase [Betaproteobacteria bacterium]|nr:adenine phosphoribosyltransferase [Betaproteobacteria bacterium]